MSDKTAPYINREKKYAPFVIQKNNFYLAYLRRTHPLIDHLVVRPSVFKRFKDFKGFGIINEYNSLFYNTPSMYRFLTRTG
jgi:hypothetical protein